MHKSFLSSLLLVALGCLILAGTGCTAKYKVARHLAEAESHFAAGEYDLAVIEYKNVLQIDPLNPPALGRLGLIYFEQGSVLHARPFLLKAFELQPDNIDLQAKLGLLDLALRNLPDARAKGLAILSRAPANPEAPLLLAEAAITPKEVAEARQRLKQLPAPAAESAPVLTALSLLELREKNTDAAEKTIQRALVLDPKYADAHAAMGLLFLMRKDLPQAEKELKLAADNSPARSSKKIQYAQFKLQQGDTAAARTLLTQMTQSTPDYLPAWALLAEMAATDKKYDDALAMVQKILARDGTYPDALLLSARLHLAKGEFATAATELERSLKLYPKSPQFLYQLGLAHIGKGETEKALDNLNSALALSPGYTDAAIMLANLNMRTGNPGAAIITLKAVVQQHPELIQARLLLAEAYRAAKNPEDALAVYEAIDRNFPGNPRTPLLRGLALLQQHKYAEARQAFNQSLERLPDFPAAVEQLVNLDIMEKHYAAALTRVAGLIEKQPKAAGGYILQARIHTLQNDPDAAEASLRKAIELQPDDPAAYFMLATLDVARREVPQALVNLQQILAKNPKDTKALMISAVLNQQLKNYDLALATFEKLLAIDPDSAIALNNAAFLYAEHFNQLEKAFQAAQKARQLLPNDPNIADTLGWILVKKHQYPWAVSLLRESVEKLPTSAEIQYHLGVAYYLSGEEEEARLTLEKSLQLKQEFPGVEEAKKHLALLQIEVGRTGAEDRKAVNAALTENPADPVALARLAAIHEADGKPAKAVEAYQAALQASPTNLKVMLNLIRLYTAQNETAKAIDLAKAARKVAPDDATAALMLGRLAFQTGDFPWAYSLLQEYARKQPDDANGQRDLAKAAYSLGRVDETVAALQQALKLDALSPAATNDRLFLELIQLADDPVQALAAKARIAGILQANPADGPALMVAGTISEHSSDSGAAIATYDKVLKQYPDFVPAKRRLAILYAAEGDSKLALNLALKARAAYPDDQELAKAYGIILYREHDYPRASSTLKDCAAQSPADPEVMYYLGLTQVQLKDPASAKLSLQRALDLKLNEKLAADARKILKDLK